jgi:phosphatidylinositol-3-phosphatase
VTTNGRRHPPITTLLLAAATALAGLGVLAAPAAAAIAPNPCSLPGMTTPATYSHVVVIFEENASYGRVVGSPDAPFFNQLAQQCALATNFHESAGVSQPNYMAATGGEATGVGALVDAPSIFDQAASWAELQESMSAPCGGRSPFYKPNHDPALWYVPLAAQCATSDLPLPASDAGVTDADLPTPLPAYTFITPNLCHNHHWAPGCSQADTESGNLQAMDTWLQGTVAVLTARPGYQAGRTLILIAFDEASDPGVTTVPMVAVAAGVQPVADDTAYDQYALLRASEAALGITTFLGHAATANDMRSGMHF